MEIVKLRTSELYLVIGRLIIVISSEKKNINIIFVVFSFRVSQKLTLMSYLSLHVSYAYNS